MSELLEELKDGVLTLTLNRPEAYNTLGPSTCEALMAALGECENNPDVRCVVVTGSGRAFCAGGDVNVHASGTLIDENASPEEAHAALVKMIRDGVTIFAKLHKLSKPTLAVINGAAAGAGLALALACDLRFCLDTAKLTTAFGKIGLSTDSGLSYFLPRIVGSAKARELCFTSDVVTGQEAVTFGLVTKIADKEHFAEEARAYAENMANLATVAIGYMKQNLDMSDHASLEDLLDLEAENVARCMATEDQKNASAAFLRKEPVVFKGR